MDFSDIVATILREFPLALYGSILVGVACAFLGVYVVARKVVFFGAVLTQVSVLGLAATFLPFVALPHTVGSLGFTLVSAVILSQLLTGKKIPRDAVLGFVFVSSVAARLLVVQKAPKVEAAEIDSLLRGDILFVTPELFWLMAGGFVLVMAVNLIFFKEFTFVAFDAETARTQGFNARRWDLTFYLLTGLMIALATHMVGDLFVFGFLVVPPVAAMLVSHKVRNIFIIAVAIGAVAPPIGLLVAFLFDLPSSPAMVAVACCVAAVFYAITLARRR